MVEWCIGGGGLVHTSKSYNLCFCVFVFLGMSTTLSELISVITVLAAPSAFGNKLCFENIEVSSGALTDISNDGLDEERTHH